MNYKRLLSENLAALTQISADEIQDMLEAPPDKEKGDLALPCFKLAKQMKSAPPKIAQELMEKFEKPNFIADVQVVGGYLNFFYDQDIYIRSVIEEALKDGENFGRSEIGNGRTVVIDYSSINIAKPFHIGHLSSTAIGSALYKIYKFLGYETVGVNHLGDWGTQFGKLIAAYKLWGDDQDIERRSIDAMLELYVRFHKEAEEDDSLNDTARGWFKKIEDGDEEALRIFKWFSELTLKEVQKIYELLDVTFDSYAGESFYNDKVGAIVDELRQKQLLEESEGAFVVRLEEYGLPPAVILKSDGTTLYITRDIAAAEYRKNTYDFYKNLYVVAYQQNLHFRQLFATVEKMGYTWAKDMEHVAFGMVSLEDGTLSTRGGKVVLLKDVLFRAVEKSLEIINEKNPGLANKENIASDIGIGAVIYQTLSQSRIKDITFSFDRVLNFDGETGPYVQYAHTKCASVLEKWKENDTPADFSAIVNAEAQAVADLIYKWPDTIVAAADKNEPFYITRHITDLAQAFNKYYFEHRIIDDDIAKTNARITLTKVVKNTIKCGLSLLGIKAPNKM